MSQETDIVFFGCWGRPGHFLWGSDKRMISASEVIGMRIPTAGQMDGGPLFLPRPEKVGTGAITHLPAPNLTVLAWWGNSPWDERGAVNNAIIARGRLGEVETWQQFNRYFFELAEKLEHPLLIKGN